MFAIATNPINPEREKQFLTDETAGGYVGFEGWVRNHNEGKAVTTLEYEAYASMAEKEGQTIILEALTRFDITGARCIHRIGKLSIGEMAVWVGVTAAHRKAAFDACEYIIDEVKHRLPIWKKETYVDGDSGWVNCQHTCTASHAKLDENNYYARQTRLPEIAEKGQQILRQSKVLVVGAGGLGCPVLQYLAGAGIGTLGICEADEIHISNLHRQTLFSTDNIGQRKGWIAAERLRQLNPFIDIEVHSGKFSEANAGELFTAYDLVVDCTDNFETKYLLSDTAVKLSKPLIQASIYQYEGQLRVYDPHKPSFCLRCLWPEPPEIADLATCGEAGVIGPTAGVMGSMQALEAIKLLLHLPNCLSGEHLMIMDLLERQISSIKQQPNPACPLCGNSELTQKQPSKKRISLEASELDAMEGLILLDISESKQTLSAPPGIKVLWIPYQEFLENPPVFNQEQNYIIACQFGGRSAFLAQKLRRQGVDNVYSLAGGFFALLELREKVGSA